MRMTTVQAVAHKNNRTASELARIGRRQQITEPPHRLDDIDPEFFGNAADEDLDRIGVAVEILVVEMLDQFGARDYPPGMMHQVRQQPVLVRCELHWIAVDGDSAGARIEANWPARELAFGVAGRTAQ